MPRLPALWLSPLTQAGITFGKKWSNDSFAGEVKQRIQSRRFGIRPGAYRNHLWQQQGPAVERPKWILLSRRITISSDGAQWKPYRYHVFRMKRARADCGVSSQARKFQRSAERKCLICKFFRWSSKYPTPYMEDLVFEDRSTCIFNYANHYHSIILTSPVRHPKKFSIPNTATFSWMIYSIRHLWYV